MEKREDLIKEVANYTKEILSGNISYVEEINLLPELIRFLAENLTDQPS